MLNKKIVAISTTLGPSNKVNMRCNVKGTWDEYEKIGQKKNGWKKCGIREARAVRGNNIQYLRWEIETYFYQLIHWR